jgi:hypothetical protein
LAGSPALHSTALDTHLGSGQLERVIQLERALGFRFAAYPIGSHHNEGGVPHLIGPMPLVRAKEDKAMFLEDFRQLAKSIESIPYDDAKSIIGIVLDRLKRETNAVIVDVWIKQPAREADVLRNFHRRTEGAPPTQDIVLTERALGYLYGSPKSNSQFGWMTFREVT